MPCSLQINVCILLKMCIWWATRKSTFLRKCFIAWWHERFEILRLFVAVVSVSNWMRSYILQRSPMVITLWKYLLTKLISNFCLNSLFKPKIQLMLAVAIYGIITQRTFTEDVVGRLPVISCFYWEKNKLKIGISFFASLKNLQKHEFHFLQA